MRKHNKKSNSVKMVIISSGKELPRGYIPIAGMFLMGQEMQIAIPERIVIDTPELANKLAQEAQNYLITLSSGQ